MKEIKIGIVGSGFGARFHIDCWKTVQGVDINLAGITSLEPKVARELATKHNIPFAQSLDTLLTDPNIDIIDVCTPDYAHEKVAIAAAKAGKHAVVEKLLTGYFGEESDKESGRKVGFEDDRALMLTGAIESVDRIEAAFKKSRTSLMYAENWVYAPTVTKIAELLSKHPDTKILYMEGEESHRGSHSPAYGKWAEHGSGATSGKLCHPLGAILRLKYEEGLRRNGKKIRPSEVTALTTHNWRDIEGYADLVKDRIRTDYLDVEDGVYVILKFDDNTVAIAKSNEYSVGGVLNTLRIDATTCRFIVNLAPNLNIAAYSSDPTVFGATAKDQAYLSEKVGHRGGGSHPAADEHWDLGYRQEFTNFANHVAHGEPLLSNMMLARDTVAICYSALVSASQSGKSIKVPIKRQV